MSITGRHSNSSVCPLASVLNYSIFSGYIYESDSLFTELTLRWLPDFWQCGEIYSDVSECGRFLPSLNMEQLC